MAMHCCSVPRGLAKGSAPPPSANRWLGLRLDFLGAVIVSTTALACIWKSGTLSPGLAGLSLSYALPGAVPGHRWGTAAAPSFVGFVSFTIRSIADAEMQMSSVERGRSTGPEASPRHKTK